MREKTGADNETKADLTAGIEAANRVLTQANAAVDRELRNEALEDLCNRVDDWKNHRVDHFGDLLLHGHFPVITGKSDVQKEVRSHSKSTSRRPSVAYAKAVADSKCKALVSRLRRSPDLSHGKEAQKSQWEVSTRQWQSLDQRRLSTLEDEDMFLGDMIFHHLQGYHPITGDPFLARKYANSLGITCPQYEQYTIYLFERILLCCKEVNPNKSKDKLMGTQKDKKDKKDKNKSREPNKNAKLQLKGRIFMTNVTEVLSLAKQGNLVEILAAH